jgi:diguanylate cyclase (GGDEF)-like protein
MPSTARPCVEEVMPWDPQLLEALHELVDCAEDDQGKVLAKGLAGLAARYGTAVHTELIHLLSHLRFPHDEAREHWERILAHREHMRAKLGVAVDLRVALVSYFVEVARKLKNPKIIEMQLFERTRDSAYRDELTGLHNYRLFREYLQQEVLRSERSGQPVSLVMADVDDFKAFNDRRGHEAGNDGLVAVARLIEGALRQGDVAARYGGEEFALILPATPKVTARLVAERVRGAVESESPHRDPASGESRLTLSLGVATYPADAQDAGELVRRADQALYVAKSGGKNQVQLYGKSRRSFERIDATLNVVARVAGGPSLRLVTRNVSEAGLSLACDGELPNGAVLDLGIELPSGAHEIRAAGRVVHLETDVAGRTHAAVRIIDMDETDRARLVEYTRKRRAEP